MCFKFANIGMKMTICGQVISRVTIIPLTLTNFYTIFIRNADWKAREKSNNETEISHNINEGKNNTEQNNRKKCFNIVYN